MLNTKHIKADLCVVGGGMAGVCAAVSAARMGVQVVLMQERPVLGGNASSEIRMWICGAHGENMRETGILEEILLENMHANPTKNPYIFDAVLLDFVRREANITLLLNCPCLDADCERDEYDHGRTTRIRSVKGYQMTTQTYFEVEAGIFADCSGDSILAPLSGAHFRIGRESGEEYHETTNVKEADGLTMGNSCLLQLRQTPSPVPNTKVPGATPLTLSDFRDREPRLYDEGENFWYLELGGTKDTIADAEQIGAELQALALGTWEHIKRELSYGAEHFALDFLGFLPGKRESRRYIGEYVMRAEDTMCAVRFSDTVAHGGWTIDDHFPGGFYHRGVPNVHRATDAPYPIPYRILYSANVENLMFAGRNVSATHMAMSSLRVMATCALLGQAVGVCAAVACKHAVTPHEVYLHHMQQAQEALLSMDVFLPYVDRPVSPLCRRLAAEAGMPALADGRDRKNRIYGNVECGVVVENTQSIVYNIHDDTKISSIHFVFDSDLDRLTMNGGGVERTHASRCNTLLSSPVVEMPKTLVRDFVLTMTDRNGQEQVIQKKDNLCRAYHIPVGTPLSRITLTPLSNWGGTEQSRIFSFDFC